MDNVDQTCHIMCHPNWIRGLTDGSILSDEYIHPNMSDFTDVMTWQIADATRLCLYVHVHVGLDQLLLYIVGNDVSQTGTFRK